MEQKSTITELDIPFPEATTYFLKLQVGACRLRIKPGDESSWISGTYNDPGGSVPLKISQEGGVVKIAQELMVGDWWVHYGEKPPVFDLVLGKDHPYTLSLEIGASENQIDLGGLPLTRLIIKYGAGKIALDFSAPNPEQMSLLELDAGAASLSMERLANANFGEMVVHGGAAGYDFDFGGELLRESHVRITAGMAAVEITIPQTTPAMVTAEAMLGSLSLGDGFSRREGAFWNQAAQDGKTPQLEITANVTLGSLKVRQT
jgi:hypothetical protein